MAFRPPIYRQFESHGHGIMSGAMTVAVTMYEAVVSLTMREQLESGLRKTTLGLRNELCVGVVCVTPLLGN
jgi:hypothetical protein